MGFDPETFDPEELVTVDGIGEMTLKRRSSGSVLTR
jgi:hypothetical protein